MFYISPLFAGPTDSMGMHYLFNLTNPNLSTKTKYYEFTPQNLSVAFCYITTAQRCFYPFALFSYSKSKGGAAVRYNKLRKLKNGQKERHSLQALVE